jgi:hypothetical protein
MTLGNRPTFLLAGLVVLVVIDMLATTVPSIAQSLWGSLRTVLEGVPPHMSISGSNE